MVKYNLNILQEYAQKLGGVLLSKVYIRNNIKLTWKCNKNHIFKSDWHHVKDRKQWCPSCNGNKKPSLLILQKYAKTKKGLLLSTEYCNSKSLLQWQCEKKHIWNASWASILHQKTWCPYCAGLAKYSIQELQKYANTKQGELLSTEYKNSNSLLIWKCEYGHTWTARWHDINQKNTWCPRCSSFKHEEICRSILENFFNCSFNKTKIKINNTWHEFDGYNNIKKIAFEYHGAQHYIYPNFWHNNKEEFDLAKQRDIAKETYCKNNNISLIIIPYRESSNLSIFIENELKLQGLV